LFVSLIKQQEEIKEREESTPEFINLFKKFVFSEKMKEGGKGFLHDA